MNDRRTTFWVLTVLSFLALPVVLALEIMVFQVPSRHYLPGTVLLWFSLLSLIAGYHWKEPYLNSAIRLLIKWAMLFFFVIKPALSTAGKVFRQPDEVLVLLLVYFMVVVVIYVPFFIGRLMSSRIGINPSSTEPLVPPD